MADASKCPSCGASFDERQFEGVCPACAWRSMFGLSDEVANLASAAEHLRIPGHEVIEEMARGGMGIIYRARQFEPNRIVALKMMLPHQIGSADARARFRSEIRAIAGLDHPAILPVYQVGELDGLPWFTMKLAGGGSLADRRNAYAGEWRLIAQLVATLADAVQFAHERGILHRDLKPGNVLFDDAGRAYLSDFGLAKFLEGDADLTASHATLGTPAYLAPELLRTNGGAATTASDLYGLGAVLYELLAGRPPFQTPGVAALLREIVERPPPKPGTVRPDVPPDLELICLKCLAKEPAARFGSARELAADLRCWLEGRPITARAASPAERFVGWCRRNPAVAALSGLLVVGAMVGGTLLVLQNQSLQSALHRSETAERRAESSLRSSLLAQARALGQSTWMGRRFDALTTLHQAATNAAGASAGELRELRDEAVAALARPDLRWQQRWLLAAMPGENSTVFAPDLESYAVAAPGGCDWHAVSNRALIRSQRTAHKTVPASLQLSGDQQTLVAAFADGQIHLWPPGSNAPALVLRGAEGSIPAADALGANGRVAWSFSGEGVKWIDSNRAPAVLITPDTASALRFHPDGNHLALVLQHGVELWRLQPPRRLWSVPMPQAIPRVQWHPDGLRLLAASRWENTIHLLSITNGETLLRYQGHAVDPARFAIHPAGRMAASIGRDGTLRVWDLHTGQDAVVLEAVPRTVQFSADGSRLGCTAGTFDMGVLELASANVYREFDRATLTTVVPESLLCDPTGTQLFVTTSIGLRRWRTDSGAFAGLFAIDGTERVWAQIDAHGERLLFGRRRAQGWQIPLSSGDLSNTALGRPLKWRDGLAVLDINPRGTLLVRVPDNGLELWPGGDSAMAKIVGRGLGGIDAALSPDDRWLALQHRQSGAVRVIETASGAQVAELAASPFAGTPRGWWTPDGRALITSSAVGFEMWETGTWRRLQLWRAEFGGESPGPAAISPDGRWLAIEQAPDEFQLIALPGGELITRLHAPQRSGAALAQFSPDGTRLWIAAQGPRVFEWNLQQLRRELGAIGLDWRD